MSNSPRTIKDLADSARRRALEVMSEAKFAKLCLQLDKALAIDLCDENGFLGDEGDEQAARGRALLEKLAFDDPDGPTWQLAMVWLDGHGLGPIKVEHLVAELNRMRKEGPK